MNRRQCQKGSPNDNKENDDNVKDDCISGKGCKHEASDDPNAYTANNYSKKDWKRWSEFELGRQQRTIKWQAATSMDHRN